MIVMMEKCGTLVLQMELSNNDMITIVETFSTENMKRVRNYRDMFGN